MSIFERTRSLPRRVRELFRLPGDTDAQVGRDVDDELAFHLEMRIAELEKSGLSHDDALIEATRQLGDITDIRQHAIAVSMPGRRWRRGLESIASVLYDIRFSIRQFRRAPLFALTAVITIALGIGANSAMFSVIHRLLLDPLPFKDGDRMVQIQRAFGAMPLLINPSRPAVDAWRTRAQSIEALTTIRSGEFALGESSDELRVTAGEIAPNFFEFIGETPAAGRAFSIDDTKAGAAPVVMISYALWRERYDRSNDALGKFIRVDSVARQIVGVAPPGLSIPFAGSTAPVLWLPLPSELIAGDPNAPMTIAKLRRGISVEQTKAELSVIADALPRERDQTTAKLGVVVRRAQDSLGDSYRRALILLFGAVSAILLIACANVAHLLLARAWGRQREFAVRSSLGAGRARLARQMLAESLALAVPGGVIGLLMAWAALRVIIGLRPSGFDNLADVHLDATVAVWTFAVAIVAAVLFGFGPAIFAASHRDLELVKAGARVANAGRVARRVRGTLIVAEVGLSVVLLVLTGLLLRTYGALQRMPLGFNPQNLSQVNVMLPSSVPPAGRRAMQQDVLARMRAVPGVMSATYGTLPFAIGVSMGGLDADGDAHTVASAIRIAGMFVIYPDYFATVGTRVRGSSFTADSLGAATNEKEEIIINKHLAQRLWPGEEALGKRLKMGAEGWRRVVGVAEDVALPGRRGDRVELQIYIPVPSAFTRGAFFPVMFRSAQPLSAVAPQIRSALGTITPAVSVRDIQTAEVQLRDSLAGRRFAMSLLLSFAALAIVLAGVGLYGVISYAVGQRTHEIGVRVALGAQARDVAWLVALESGALVGLGLVAGLGGAIVATRTVRTYLFGVGPLDPITYVGVGVVVGIVALLACFGPARRAMRVDPVVALAAE